jgi:hypothetical protein
MITTRISIKEHLSEFMIGRYNHHDEQTPIRFPDSLDLYHTIYDLLVRRPANVSGHDTGNLYFFLPEIFPGKKTSSYNYLGVRSVKIIEKKIEVKFWAEVHDLFDHNKTMHGINYIESAHQFLTDYGISAISEDALLKNYQRWRDKVRKHNKRRNYNKK